MHELLEMLKQNKGIAVGAVGGYFLSGQAIGMVEKAAAPVVGQVAGKWLRAGSALLVSGIALYAGKKLKKTQMAVAFAGVSLGQAINSGVAAVKGG